MKSLKFMLKHLHVKRASHLIITFLSTLTFSKNAPDSNKNLTDVGFKLLYIIQIVLEGNRVTIMNREQEARGTKSIVE